MAVSVQPVETDKYTGINSHLLGMGFGYQHGSLQQGSERPPINFLRDVAIPGSGRRWRRSREAQAGSPGDRGGFMATEFLQNWGWLESTKGFQARGCHTSTHHLKSQCFPARPGREALPGSPERGASPGLLEGEKLPPKKGAWQLGLPSWVLCREQGTRGAHPAGSRETNHEQGSSPALPLLPPPCSVPGAVPAAAAAPRWCRFCWLSQDNSLPFLLLAQPGRLSCAGRLSIPQGSCANSGETEAGSVWRL